MRLAIALVLVAATSACDRLATGGYKPPYATITGWIDGYSPTSTVMPQDVHVAILWQNDVTPNSNYAEQPVDVVTSFPAQFKVPIVATPRGPVVDTAPADSLTELGLDPTLTWATGTLVAFADGDKDGKLTMRSAGDLPSPDVILAAGLEVFWLGAGTPAPAEWVGIFPTAPGFSLVREAIDESTPKPGQCGWFDAFGHYSDLCQPTVTPQALDISADQEHLTLVDDPRLQGYSCRSYWGAFEYADFNNAPADQICDGGACTYCRGYQCPPDLPGPHDTVNCSGDGLAYVYKRCVDDVALCGTRLCHWGHGERRATDPTPANWPCP